MIRANFRSIHRVAAVAGFAAIQTSVVTCEAHLPDQIGSIHFNSGRPDFGTLPRRAMLQGEGDLRPTAPDVDPEWFSSQAEDASGTYMARQELGDGVPEAKKAARDFAVRKSAKAMLVEGRWSDALRLYTELAAFNGWTGDLRDRVETLQETLSTPASARAPSAIRCYLAALDRTYQTTGQEKNPAMAEFRAIAVNPRLGYLRAHAYYQMACLDIDWLDFAKAIRELQVLVHNFPNSSKRDAALIMIARTAILPETWGARDAKAGALAIETLLRVSPRSRFRRAALGLRARLDFLSKRYQKALQGYVAADDMPSLQIVLNRVPPGQRKPYHLALVTGWLRALSRADSYDSYATAVRFLRDSIANLSLQEARHFVRNLLADPEIDAPYIYYRLYLCENKPTDIEHLGRLADRLVASRPNRNGLSSLLMVRLGEIAYQRKKYVVAIQWADLASARYAADGPFDRALYVKGASLHKLGRDHASMNAFETLLRKCPDSPLRFATREELALLREITGDLQGALREYFYLDYRPDIAFFLDARMTTAEVAKYVAAHPFHREHSLLVYSLGIRYLRDENWKAARNCLLQVARPLYMQYGSSPDDNGYRQWETDENPDPLKALRDLSSLEAAVSRQSSANGRASALFRYASYYYKSPSLLLYNGALWRGRRELNFDFWWNSNHATKADEDRTDAYMHDHETYARCERICLKIAREYPKSPTRPYALYRAACCENDLSNFNGWWRGSSHRRAAARLMAQLAREYPHHALAAEARKFAQVWKD